MSEWREKAEQAYEETRRLAPDHPMVLLLGAGIGLGRDDYWLEKERVLQQVQPDWDPAFLLGSDWDMYYGAFLTYTGRAREAIAPLQRVRQKQPLAWGVAVALAEAYANTGNIPAAMEELERAATLPNANQFLITLQKVQNALAVNDLQAINTNTQTWFEINPGDTFDPKMAALATDKPALRAALRRAWSAWSDPANRTVGLSLAIAIWSAYAGDPELALEALNVVVDATTYSSAQIWTYYDADMTHRLQWRPLMREVRRLPGFKDLVRKLGLAGYWRKSGAWGDFCRPVGDDDFECK